MITDFPDVKKIITDSVNQLLKQKLKEKGTLQSLANRKNLYEGDQFGLVNEDGSSDVGPLQSTESTVTIEKKDLENNASEHLVGKVDELAENMSANIEQGLAKTMLDSAEKNTGAFVKGKGDFSADGMLDALEALPIEFEDDDRSKPVAPFLATDPDTFRKIKEQEAEITPAEQEVFDIRQNAIYDTKYAEHMKDVESRKITD